MTAIPFSSTIYAGDIYLDAYYPFKFLSSKYYDKDIDYSLWDKFLKYDLCITSFDSLNKEEQELCRFIFETERSAQGTVRCERARRTLAKDTNLGGRITLDEARKGIQICDKYSIIYTMKSYQRHCVPDIKHIDGDMNVNEYWLDESGNERILYDGEGDLWFSHYCLGYIHYDENVQAWCNENIKVNISSPKLIFMDDMYYYLIMPEGKAWVYEPIDCNSVNEHPIIELDGNKYYILPDNTALIYESKYKNKYSDNSEPVEKTVIVPEEVDGYPVVGIESEAFMYSTVTDVILPDSITYIGSNAFSCSGYLNKISFPKSLEIIGVRAFSGCTSITKADINCPELKLSRWMFENSGLEDVSLTVKSIDEQAFMGCKQLENVTLNEGIEIIEANAFENCTNLKSIKLPLSLKIIGQGAFSGTLIKSIKISPYIEVIGKIPQRIGLINLSGPEPIPPTDPLTEKNKLIIPDYCTICGYYDTEPHHYALANNLKFVPLDGNIAYGDINIDGIVNVADAVVLQSYILGRATSVGYEADLNQDGRIDVLDIVAMRRKLLEKSLI